MNTTQKQSGLITILALALILFDCLALSIVLNPQNRLITGDPDDIVPPNCSQNLCRSPKFLA